MPLHVTRTATILKPNQSRVLLRPFSPGDAQRASRRIARILSLPEERTGALLEDVCGEFSRRHERIRQRFLERYEQVREELPADQKPGEGLTERIKEGSRFQRVLGQEIRADQLPSPSIVPHPDQTGLPDGALRFVLSLRATGEGHISSITFRTGVVHPDHRIEVHTPTGFLTEARQAPNTRYEKDLFARKLIELGLSQRFCAPGDEQIRELIHAGRTALQSRG